MGGGAYCAVLSPGIYSLPRQKHNKLPNSAARHVSHLEAAAAVESLGSGWPGSVCCGSLGAPSPSSKAPCVPSLPRPFVAATAAAPLPALWGAGGEVEASPAGRPSAEPSCALRSLAGPPLCAPRGTDLSPTANQWGAASDEAASPPPPPAAFYRSASGFAPRPAAAAAGTCRRLPSSSPKPTTGRGAQPQPRRRLTRLLPPGLWTGFRYRPSSPGLTAPGSPLQFGSFPKSTPGPGAGLIQARGHAC